MMPGGCRTFGTLAAIRPQRSFFTVFLAYSYGYGRLSASQTASQMADFTAA